MAQRTELGIAEVWGPTPGAWTRVGNLTTKRYIHAAVKLTSGKVLIAGGESYTGNPFGDAELFDPATNSFTAVGSMAFAHTDYSAVLLPSGKVRARRGGRQPWALLGAGAARAGCLVPHAQG